jgi:signal transduction histidine kinase
MSVRTRLLLALGLLAIAPITIAGLLFQRVLLSRIDTEAKGQLRYASESITQRIDSFVAYTLEQARTDAQIPRFAEVLRGDETVRASNANELIELLRQVTVKDPIHVMSCALADINGTIVAETRADLNTKSESARPYFAWVIKNGLPILVPPALGGNDVERYLTVAAPVRDKDDAIFGVIIWRYEPAVLQQILVAEMEGRDSSIQCALIDEMGLILAFDKYPSRRGFSWTPLPEASIQELVESRRISGDQAPSHAIEKDMPASDGSGTWIDRDGTSGRYAVVDCREVPWRTIALQNEGDFTAMHRTVRNAVVTLLAIVTIAMVASAFLVAHWISAPLTRLSTAVEQIGPNDLDVSLPPATGREVVLLTSRFSALLDRLRDALTDLKQRIELQSRTEAKLLTYQNNLEELVESRTRELKEAHEDLLKKTRLATLGQLVATVSHEIRNPLGTINGSLQIIENVLAGKAPEIARPLERCKRNVARCNRIIEDLLSFTRTPQLHPEPMEIDAIVRQFEDDFNWPPNVERTFDYAAAETRVVADPDRFRQCLVNVVTNAFDAMNEANAKRASAVQPMHLSIRTRAVNGCAEVIVTDTGAGISDDLREKIFEPLFSTKGFGIGLGLPLVRDLMQQQGGGVRIAETSPQGTSFVLWLPILT